MLFLIELSARRVAMAGLAAKADRIWMDQVARNLCDAGDRFLRGKRYLIHDRFGKGSLRKVIHEFMAHYHGERNHQGLDNRLIIPDENHAGNRAAIRRRKRLGGMLNYCYQTLGGCEGLCRFTEGHIQCATEYEEAARERLLARDINSL